MVDDSRAPGTRARSVPRRAGLAAVAGLACAQAGCSLILDFDQPVDAGPADAPVTDTACLAFEPNEDAASAIAIVAGDHEAAICGGGDTDYFKITLDGTQSVLARITFMNRNGAGDIDLKLLNSSGASVLDESRTSADTEEVKCPGGLQCTGPLPAGDYLLQVLGFSAAVQSAYVLHVEVATVAIDAGV